MIPKVDGDATPLGQRSLLYIVHGHLLGCMQLDGWFKSWVRTPSTVLCGGRSSVETWYTTTLDIEESLSAAVDSHVHLFVADVVKSFDTVDRVTCLVRARTFRVSYQCSVTV